MAWRTFYDAYFDRLWRYLLVVTAGNEDAAREALQATLVRVTRHIKVFQDENIFWSWLAVLARSAFADETRKQRRYFSFLERFTLHTGVEHAGAHDQQTDERLQVLLERKIALLPTDEQKLVGQKYFSRRGGVVMRRRRNLNPVARPYGGRREYGSADAARFHHRPCRC